MTIRVACVGEYNGSSATHTAIASAFEDSRNAGPVDDTVDVDWITTTNLDASNVASSLSSHDAVWIAPGSPYASMDGALAAIGHARREGVPLLGTCGGFQHIVLEYAHEVLGLRDAAHEEYDPYASILFVSALACSLGGQSMTVNLTPGSLASTLYGRDRPTERYYCNFGLNQDYADALGAAGLVVSGTDQDGEARIVELPGHPFFVGTLFVPQTSSSPTDPHPLITGFLTAASSRAAHR